MISVKEAKQLITKYLPKPGTKRVPLGNSLGCVLAENVRSKVSLPSFNNSAMDGFVLRASDVKSATSSNPVKLKIRGSIKAGDFVRKPLGRGETYRIMTGAPLLKGGDTILPVEEMQLNGKSLVISSAFKRGRHVRLEGEEIKKNQLCIKKGALITPGLTGFLASCGSKTIGIYPKPKVSVIATGSELVDLDKKLLPGKIYDSNRPLLMAALEEMGITPLLSKTVRDNEQLVRTTIRNSLKKCDVMILMGGVSVGDYDFVKSTLKQLGVKEIFWKVKQKPGKPLYFGKKGKTLVFGLPGNSFLSRSTNSLPVAFNVSSVPLEEPGRLMMMVFPFCPARPRESMA